MEAVRTHEGLVCPLNRSNIDTDQIIPKQFLKRIERTGFGQFLFYHWRFDDEGNERTDFQLNRDVYRDASILIAGENFGCGSSREHAPWALLDHGIKVVIAPSFADIFYNNALRNGLLPIQLDETLVKRWMRAAESAGLVLKVDLEKQAITSSGEDEVAFEVPAHHQEKLLNGWDEISLTLQLEDKILEFEQAR